MLKSSGVALLDVSSAISLEWQLQFSSSRNLLVTYAGHKRCLALARGPDRVLEKRIIFVNRFFYPDQSASSQMLSDLAFDLAKTGMSVHVVASRLTYEGQGTALSAREVVNGVNVHRVWSSRFGRGNLVLRALDYSSFYISAASKLWVLAKKNSILVAKTDPPLICFVAAPIAWIRGAKLVNWLQDIFPEVAQALDIKLIKGPVFYSLRWVRNLTLRSATMNVVLGKRMQDLLMNQGVRRDRITVIDNWADNEAVKPVRRLDNKLRSSWKVDDKFVVGYSGNLGRAHEIQTIILAVEELRDQNDIVFLFIGGGANYNVLQSEASKRGLTNILCKPYQSREDLSESLSVADVHLISLNPLLEGLIVPSKFYGILSVGRPSIFIGDLSGEIADRIQRHGCGASVEVGNVVGLVEEIKKAKEDTGLCSIRGMNASSALKNYYEKRISVNIWQDMLGGQF